MTDVREIVREAVAEATAELREQVTSLQERVDDLEDDLDAEREARRDAEEERDRLQERVDDLEDDLDAERKARREAEAERDRLQERVDDLAEKLETERDARHEAESRVEALEARTTAAINRTKTAELRIAELQSREIEKGAHLLFENVEKELLDVDPGRVERITKDDGRTYARLPGEEDALERGGQVVHSTADLLPIQRFARYDDEMLASITNRKPDELAAKAWRERENAGRYELWSKGSGPVRVYLDSSALAQWIRAREQGVTKKYSQELARRTMDAMRQLSKNRLVEKKKQRRKDGLQYKERRLVLMQEAELPGETTTDPATDEAVGD
jgi:outer membrane murein-binding lipoprotein Lpp